MRTLFLVVLLVGCSEWVLPPEVDKECASDADCGGIAGCFKNPVGHSYCVVYAIEWQDRFYCPADSATLEYFGTTADPVAVVCTPFCVSGECRWGEYCVNGQCLPR